MKKKKHNFLSHLRSQGVRLTGPRKAVLLVLEGDRHPLSVKEVWARCPEPKSDLVSVYRILDRFEKEKVAVRIDLGDGTVRYEIHRDDDHHHHARCVACRRIVHVEICVDDIEVKVLKQSGFHILNHEIQLSGLCCACAKKASNADAVKAASALSHKARR